jgi:hypothetical protein
MGCGGLPPLSSEGGSREKSGSKVPHSKKKPITRYSLTEGYFGLCGIPL